MCSRELGVATCHYIFQPVTVAFISYTVIIAKYIEIREVFVRIDLWSI